MLLCSRSARQIKQYATISPGSAAQGLPGVFAPSESHLPGTVTLSNERTGFRQQCPEKKYVRLLPTLRRMVPRRPLLTISTIAILRRAATHDAGTRNLPAIVESVRGAATILQKT